MNGTIKKDKPIKIAILGARGIGKVHARIFHALGAEVYAILGTSIKTATETSDDFMRSHGFKPMPFSDLHQLLSEPIDAVCICTPPHLHLEHTLAAFNKGLAVFCEKPLFWNKEMSTNDMLVKLDQVKSHPNRRFIMNAPNAYYLDFINDRINKPDKIHSFKFSFHTNGKYKGEEIGKDLFTHGVSLIYKIFGLQNMTSFNYRITDDKYFCSFIYGNCRIEFDFKEDPNGTKLFLFDIDDRIFTRIQEGFGSNYNVYLLDSETNEKIKVTDPFFQSVDSFINYCKNGSPLGYDNFEEAEIIMKIMIQHLNLRAN